MRVAFGMIGGELWTGGVNYLENLLSAIADNPAVDIEPVLVVGSDADTKRVERLSKFLRSPVVVSPSWNRGARARLSRAIPSYLLQRDFMAERVLRSARVDVAFQHGAWLGAAFGIPTLAWIADFQHRRHPEMFSRLNRLKRAGLARKCKSTICSIYPSAYLSKCGHESIRPLAARPRQSPTAWWPKRSKPARPGPQDGRRNRRPLPAPRRRRHRK